jgi:hypothetical protein
MVWDWGLTFGFGAEIATDFEGVFGVLCFGGTGRKVAIALDAEFDATQTGGFGFVAFYAADSK